MNIIEFEATIICISKFQSALSIHCQNNPFPGKVVRFSANVIGAERERWEDKINRGDLITIRGNIAEVKQNTYGMYIAIYNPVILCAKRVKTEIIEMNNPL